MKNKVIYSLVLIFSISLIASAKKIADCNASCCDVKKAAPAKEAKSQGKSEPATLSLFFFNI